MNRGKRIIILAHCILNANAKVYGLSTYPAVMTNLVNYLIENNIAIIQLPCPEMEIYGIQRWGHVKEQFDTLHFREKCSQMLKGIVGQIKNYRDNNYEVLGIVGINGSPSCGVTKTCSSKEWYGDFLDKEETWGRIEKLSVVNGMGVFIEELTKLLQTYDIQIPLWAVDEMDFENSTNEIVDELNAILAIKPSKNNA